MESDKTTNILEGILSTNTNLKKENGQLKSMLIEIQETNTTLEANNKHLKTRNESILIEIRNLSEILSTLEATNKDLKTQNQLILIEIRNLSEMLSKLEETNTILEDNNKNLKLQEQNIILQFNDQHREIQENHKNFNEFENKYKSENNVLLEENKELQKELKFSENTRVDCIKKLSDKLKTANEIHENFESKIMQENKVLLEENEELQKENKTLKFSENTSVDCIKKLSDRLKAANEIHENFEIKIMQEWASTYKNVETDFLAHETWVVDIRWYTPLEDIRTHSFKVREAILLKMLNFQACISNLTHD